jgi:hypothetical protein
MNDPCLIQQDVRDNLPDHPPPNRINEIEDKTNANKFCLGTLPTSFRHRLQQLHRQRPVNAT